MKTKLLLTTALVSSTILFSCGQGNLFNGEGGEGGATGFHYQGQSCAQCHSSGENSFPIGGTIFSNLHAQNGDVNSASIYHYVRLILNDNKKTTIYSIKGNGAGNFKAYGNIPAGVKFKVEVLDGNGNVVNKTAGYTHDNTRLDCNRCHTSTGITITIKGNKIKVPGRIVSYDFYKQLQKKPAQPPKVISFSKNVYKILQRCQTCHNATNHGGNLIIAKTATTTYNNLMTKIPATQGYTSFINKNSPSNSLLLQKATNSISHGGGQVFTTNSQEYQTILKWIQQGAKNN